MAQVDFYQLSRDPVERVAVTLARKLFDAGDRLVIVARDPALRATISGALWQADASSFLAHDMAGGADDGLQPILISPEPSEANGAQHVLIADGEWRASALAAERVFYLFGPDHLDAARAAWRSLNEPDGINRNFWRQEGGKWRKGP